MLGSVDQSTLMTYHGHYDVSLKCLAFTRLNINENQGEKSVQEEKQFREIYVSCDRNLTV